MAFKQGFELYTQTSLEALSLSKLGDNTQYLRLKGEIEDLRSSINRKRYYFYGFNREFRITPYWLLGFVEWDGSFLVSINIRSGAINFAFCISQSVKYRVLMEEIKNYCNNLARTASVVLASKIGPSADYANLRISKHKLG